MNNQHIDLSFLSESVHGKKHLVKEMLDIFLKELPDGILNLEDAIAKKDYETVKQVAHRMTSSVSILGIQDMRSLLLEIQATTKTNLQSDAIEGQIKKLRGMAKAVIEEIKYENEKLIS
ncbi:MAG: hypothetical protein EPO57_02775 [Chitinophagaceae bacterium]|nr:MAG: hypothetical protein EPO57_02775 [Chitinophagaceae bacterium]